MRQTFKKNKNSILVTVILFTFIMIAACGGSEDQASAIETSTPTKVEEKPKKKLSAGERVFLLCKSCHNLKQGEPHKVGPNLHGFLGSKAASKEGFNYSEALKNANIVWDENQLRNWMEKPMNYIPGTTMAFVGIKDKDQQQVLIDYLKKETK